LNDKLSLCADISGTEFRPTSVKPMYPMSRFLLRSCMFVAALVACGPLFAGSAPGIRNFDRVDEHVYRGAQPTSAGLAYLAKLGVKTIVDLRQAGGRSAAEERAVSALGMHYVSVPMAGFAPASDAEMAKVLGLLEDGGSGPVFVHCRRGADRTGAVIAAYHIDHDNWNNARALKDAKAHGMSVFQIRREHYISDFHRRVAAAVSSSAAATTATTLSANAEAK
jgi:tyrosine-protein phosphatase SIW14